MRRPINWFVVLFSICVLLTSMTLSGNGAGRADSAADDNHPTIGLFRQVVDARELETLHDDALVTARAAPVPTPAVATLMDFRARYTVEPKLAEFPADEFAEGELSLSDYLPAINHQSHQSANGPTDSR